MSKPTVAAEACLALGAPHPELQPYPAHSQKLGKLPILRALPVRGRRMIGPWCFLDRFGPLTFDRDATPMDVAPHPHIGLQTVTWLLEGEILHDDSLAQEALLRPGGLNVMTAGHAISHAERTPGQNTGRLNGVQLWTALPDAQRHRMPEFQQLTEVPRLEVQGSIAQVFSGTLGGVTSPAHHFSELVAADLQVHPAHCATLPLQPEHEHGVLLLTGECALEGQPLEAGTLYYLGTQRAEVTLASKEGARLLLIGGPPFPETILMWWNFVARTPDEIRQAREDWEAHRRFAEVPAYQGPRLAAPELMRLAPPNPMS